MSMPDTTATEYRNLPLAVLTESTTNPRRIFDPTGLEELAATIRNQGVLSALLVRPLNEQSFEIVFGARRYRAAQMAGVETVPVRIKQMSDAEVLEAQLIENLVRRDVHPMEEAQGFKALLDLEEPKYSVEQIAARTGKSPVYVATRLKLIDLVPAAVEAFYREEIGVGHALLLAKLPAEAQEEALKACFREDWSGVSKQKRILLPVRNLQFWIEQNVLLLLKEAPFDKRDAHLVAIAGSCLDCPKRTGHNKLLFSDFGNQDACVDGVCYQAKVSAYIAKTLAAKPKLVQISTSYAKPEDGSSVLPRGRYVVLQDEKPKDKQQAQRPEYKTCKLAMEAIVVDGQGIGTTHTVCVNPDCPVHHPKKQQNKLDASIRAQQEKERRDRAIADVTNNRVLAAIAAAVPVRLMKRDLLFVAERLSSVLQDNHLVALARHHGLRQNRSDESLPKLFAALLHRTEEGELGKLVVELALVASAARGNGAKVLHEAANLYKVDADAIARKVRHEFAVKEKTKAEKKTQPKPGSSKLKKSA